MIEIYLDNFQDSYHNVLSKIITEIARIKTQYLVENGFEPSILVVGHRVFNFISDSKVYSTNYNLTGEDIGPLKVGKFLDLDVYLDIEMENKLIKLTTDIGTARDMKIKSILDESNIGDKFTVDIKLISDII